MTCGYGERACGSRFSGYPCNSGPPILDANNNVVPKRTVLCGSEVCTKTASFRDYVSIGDTSSAVNVAEVDIFGNEQLFGTLTVDPATSPTLTAGIVLAADSTFASRADLDLGATSAGPGASLVYAKSSPGAAVNPTRGGRLDVVFYDPVGATSASGFLYTSQLPPYYLNANFWDRFLPFHAWALRWHSAPHHLRSSPPVHDEARNEGSVALFPRAPS